MKVLCILLLIIEFISIVKAQINWQPGNWAMSCDFKGNDLSNQNSKGEDCGGICSRTAGCTHFTWTNYNGGTCWMKSGQVNKNNAFKTGDTTAACGIVSNVNQVKPVTPVNPRTPGDSVSFRIINRCSYTIWPGIQGRSKNPSFKLPFNGGWELGAGKTTTFSVPKDLEAARIWARTNCINSNGVFRCATGDCGFFECAQGGIQRGGATPASLAEFTLNGHGNQDYYDVSLVDGYNLKIGIKVQNPNNERPGTYWCKNPECVQDLNLLCPEALKKKSSSGAVIGCLSACEKFNTDEYCCRGKFDQPTTCKSSKWPVNYPSFFKKACPMAYSYAYDDRTSTFFCRNTGYDVIFC